MDLPCRCGRQYKHGSCLGFRADKQEQYTKEYVHRVSRILCQELSHQGTIQECAGITQLLEGFGEGEFCTCGEAKGSRFEVECACCLKGREDVPGDQGLVVEEQLENETGMTSEDLECFGSPVAQSEAAEIVREDYREDLEAQARRLREAQNFQHQACEQILEQLPYKPSPKHREVPSRKPRLDIWLLDCTRMATSMESPSIHRCSLRPPDTSWRTYNTGVPSPCTAPRLWSMTTVIWSCTEMYTISPVPSTTS